MTKKIEKEIAIDATPEEVWRALSEGEQLKRWFPLDARVKPGVGGAVWLSWGEGSDWESPIEIWEPNRHLRTVDTTPATRDKPAARIAVDYIIKTRGGTTVLRVVHSGFADDAGDDEQQSLDAGWASFLATLKNYLERHRGEPRALAFFRHPPVELPRSEVYRRVMKTFGLQGVDSLKPGERYSSANGIELAGVADIVAPPINFSGTVENLGNAFLMIEIEPGRQRCRPAVWLSLYGDMRSRAAALQEEIRDLLTGTFTSP